MSSLHYTQSAMEAVYEMSFEKLLTSILGKKIQEFSLELKLTRVGSKPDKEAGAAKLCHLVCIKANHLLDDLTFIQSDF